ncbi:MAG: bifunctional diaminohydroxyphosphoribosylaminopyrimidine deaminase/5-amino-6-(5-phosphoribosylamino)uracil reductase RibD [Thermodesulfobacteriota bacterium]
MTGLEDERFMREALRLARKGIGRTSPNPAVGAVLVRRGRVVATGYHRKAGGPHAEVEAIRALKGPARPEDVLYVTLEPCNHHGRTPPCTRAVLEAGIRRVVIGMTDPNPGVSGGGCAFLESRGVEVRAGVLEKDCRALNEAFIKHVTTGRPFVIAKTASTLDGWTATGSGHSRWVTNEQSRRFVHRLRDRCDAVLVGVGTVLADDPSLTTRLAGRRGRDPIRVIVDTRFRTPDRSRVLHSDSAAETLIVVVEGLENSRLDALSERAGVVVVRCPAGEGGLDLDALLGILGAKGIMSVLVEGGAAIMGSMMRGRLVDKVYMFKAPKLLCGNDGIPVAAGPGAGRMDQCLALGNIRVRRFGDDVLIRGYTVNATGTRTNNSTAQEL